MKKIIIIAISLFSVVLTSTVLAKPAKCPSSNVIIAAGIPIVEKDVANGLYEVGNISTYDTTDQWAFAVAIPLSLASSEADALNKARVALASLSGNPPPAYYQPENKWICVYNIGSGYFAAAITPVVGKSSFSSVRFAK